MSDTALNSSLMWILLITLGSCVTITCILYVACCLLLMFLSSTKKPNLAENIASAEIKSETASERVRNNLSIAFLV